MNRQGMALEVWVIVAIALMITGCRSEVVVAANLTVGAIPCVLMYLVLNLKRDR